MLQNQLIRQDWEAGRRSSAPDAPLPQQAGLRQMTPETRPAPAAGWIPSAGKASISGWHQQEVGETANRLGAASNKMPPGLRL